MASVPRIKTGEVRFTFVHLAEPHGFEDSTPKYQISILIPKKDKATIDALKANYTEAIKVGKDKFGAAFGGRITPFIRPEGADRGIMIDCDTDEKYMDDEDYQGHYMVNVKSTTQPDVLARETGKRKLDADEIKEIVYSGCYGKLTMNLYPHAKPKAGIAAGLGNVLKTRDGEYLGGRASGESDFSDDLDVDYGLDDDDDI